MRSHMGFVLGAILVSAWLAVVTVACASNMIAETPPAPTETLPRLPDLSLATAISIQDDWNGLSRGAPIIAHIRLERVDDQFIGTAYYSVGGNRSNPVLSATETVTVPLSAVNDFMGTLASAQLETGPYIIPPTHTDDYPRVSLQIELGEERLTFYSDSQNADHAPWLLTVNTSKQGNSKFVIHSGVPAQALNGLNAYLKRDVQQKLIEQVQSPK